MLGCAARARIIGGAAPIINDHRTQSGAAINLQLSVPVIEPKRIPRSEHSISRSQLPSAVLKTLYTLKDAGYEAYVVGGGVRDLLAGLKPKDFDIATNARPEQVKALFRGCRLIGRRFVICHVRWGDEVLEVTTFRGPITDSHERDETGRILADNEYGTLEEDAFRRDFTVNALYYDIRDFSIVDYTGGLDDLRHRELRLIGDPEQRYREDPVRMIRAVRIANKLGFHLDEAAAAPMFQLAPLLAEIPPARLFDEVIKILQSTEALANFRWLLNLGLYAQLFPAVMPHLGEVGARPFVEAALESTAARLAAEQPVSPAFLYAALLWPAVAQRYRQLTGVEGLHPNVAIVQAGEAVLAQTVQRVAIPKRFSFPMREIWQMQPRFEQQRQGGRARRLMAHPRFRAAYDFLLLRARCGEAPQELADGWTAEQQGVDLPPPVETGPADPEQAPRKRRRRRGGRRRHGREGEAAPQS
jgi:poly(A) polymerase